jgi:hypothetical protein
MGGSTHETLHACAPAEWQASEVMKPDQAALQNSLRAGGAQVRAACGHPVFAQMAATVAAVLDEDAAPGRAAFVARTQQCFAVRPGADSFLDLARAAFCRASEEVHALAAHLRDAHDLPSLRVRAPTCQMSLRPLFSCLCGAAAVGSQAAHASIAWGCSRRWMQAAHAGGQHESASAAEADLKRDDGPATGLQRATG